MHICFDKIQRQSTKRTCRSCKAAYMRKYRLEKRYESAQKLRHEKIYGTQMEKAGRMVKTLMKSGKIPKASRYLCVDCKNKAQVYDHRDYNKPFDIEPVCRSCNANRGPGLNRGY